MLRSLIIACVLALGISGASAQIGGGTSGTNGPANPTATAGPSAVPGTSNFFMRSDGAPAVQLGTTSQPGLLQPDGLSTFVTVGGVLSGPRIKLTGATTFYVSTAGTDNSTCGLTSGTPCATMAYTYAIRIVPNYDAAGQTITIQLAAGTYTSGLNMSGAVVGQTSPVIVSGDCSSSANTQSVIVQPTTSQDSFSAVNGAVLRVQCLWMDHSKILGQPGSGSTTGADMVAVGASGKIYIGNPSLFGSYADVTFGCTVNPWNIISVAFSGAYFEVDNDFQTNTTLCAVNWTGNTTSGSASVTSASGITNLHLYQPAVTSGTFPSDAYVSSISGTTVGISCTFSTPCTASSTTTGVSFTSHGGGQAFMDIAQGATVYANTNGEPDYSIIMSLSGYLNLLSGFIYANDQASVNWQAITYNSSGLALGKCVVATTLSVVDTGGGTQIAVPCRANSPEVSTTATLTSGTNTFTVGSATGIVVGMSVTDVALPSGTWTAGASTITVSGNTGIVVGMTAHASVGILAGATVTSVSGTTIGLGGCAAGGPRCVSGYPTYLSEASATQLFFENGLMDGSCVVSAISGTSVTVTGGVGGGSCVRGSGSATLNFNNRVTLYSVYK